MNGCSTFIREDLKLKAPRTMAVMEPLKVVITNYPEGQAEMLEAENNSENPEMGNRQIPFSREIYIEQDDFMENPPNKYFRLFPAMKCVSNTLTSLNARKLLRMSRASHRASLYLRCGDQERFRLYWT